ncbi:sn-glycerol-3-phosphate ABC transporter ATP-binding protein UgpC [Aminobacter sp. MDW-2]|uniref:sn-glycerol-3-phosphate ABC transporter ATP-binding protein UgpC n=1 Tax=Aminobacter sp. MDW-2 TaxID=2666139 RepID=UPI0012AF01DD|nr:sn-glycerol-3-phosphate ABC transporter ATP-binding protein UgpC [Aminobacter sp. MDW-2]MRX36420.1 sn-glycerol-3-phosphate ABC transporter ATP-binding protein UgpC [Aminobacter sp. MDW-2]QNH36518.1 sn-glycerol-3-phosphate ABC transporter ATP-binding protein UgpC [Aminobacter sp. MDW-2]
MAQIAIRGVRKTYGKNEVVHGIDLDISSGELVVILGPSGCGKSTLLRMVAGLEAISDGDISIAGKIVNKLEPRERGCAMVFQNYALYPHMTVADNIGYALKIAGISKTDRRERVKAVATSLGLGEFLDRKPGQLSGGQRQRVAMGRAMIREPKVFLYDEPLSNLDARLRVAMRVEIRKLHQRLGATTLFVTHDQIEAMTLADRIVVMNKGVIEQVGAPVEIYQRPATTYVAGFIGTPGLNLLPGTIDPAKGIITLEDGQELAYDRGRWPAAVPGPITAGFRAEAVELGSGGLSGTYEFSEELGAAQLVHGTVAKSIVIAHIVGSSRRKAGEPLSFRVVPQHLQLFDHRSGRRLSGEKSPEVSLDAASDIVAERPMLMPA